MDDDAMWAEALLRDLPSVPASAALERRILGDFDRVAVKRRGFWLTRLSEVVWPGAPAWGPAAVFAAALAVGVVAGNAMPLEDTTEQAATIALDEPPSFDLGEAS